MTHFLETPREIDPGKTFDALVTTAASFADSKKIPGLIIGISGTDSIVAFMVCAKAFEKLQKPGRVIGIHYGGRPATPNEQADTGWFAKTIAPWLTTQTPDASVIIDTSIDAQKDGQRWGDLYDRSVMDPEMGCPLPTGGNYWVVSTMNATERALGTYSNASMGASFQPIEQLWKSEILKLCEYLRVPDIALKMSRQAHVVCGRCQFMAGNIEEIDEVLMVRAGQLSAAYLKDNYDEEHLKKITGFVERQIKTSSFKKEIPYLLQNPVIVTASPQ